MVTLHAVFHHTVFPATVGAVKTLLTVLLSLESVLAPQQGAKPGYVIRIPVGVACTQFTRPCLFFFFAEVRLTS